MAKNSKTSFIVSNPPEDLGVMLYASGAWDEEKQKKRIERNKKPWRSPAAIYLFAILAFLIFWFSYSLIYALKHYNTLEVLFSFGSSFFALFVCSAIILASTFKLWAKIGRFALKHGFVKRSEAGSVAQSVEMMEDQYEKMEQELPFFEVYGSFIRATDNDGAVKIFDREKITQIKAYKRGGRYKLALRSAAFEFEWIKYEFPKRELKNLKELFGDILQEDKFDKSSGVYSKQLAREIIKDKILSKLPIMIMGLIAAGAGGAVIALHYYLSEQIPIALGAFFMAGGALVCCSAFDGVPAVNRVVIPMLFGGVFAVIPLLFCKVIADAEGIPIFFSSVHEFLISFSPLFCAVAFLTLMGGFMILYALWQIIKYIRTGDFD